MLAKRRVLKLLDGLGSTPDEIAEKLRAEGVHGLRHKAQSCPIAVYLKRHGFRNADAGVVEGGFRSRRGYVTFPLPTPVTEFVRAFDGYRYEDLYGWDQR